MNRYVLCLSIALTTSTGMASTARAADLPRQADVAKRGADVMPFSLHATIHIFTKTDQGGTQRVVAREASDALQTRLVRQHLHDIQRQFRKGDFSGPAHIHGDDMPGLAELKVATPGAISVAYADVKGGAELTYRTNDAQLVDALHRWFDAQLSDHGADATQGHQHQHQHGDMPKQ